MERRWLNETRTDDEGRIIDVLPDENGEYTLEIVNSRGNRVSTFKGHSLIEVNEKIAEAQVQANRQLGRLLKPDKGREPPFKPQPQEITAEDRQRYSSDITDPNRVVEVIEEVVTKKQGAPPAKVTQSMSTFDQDAADAYYKTEAEAFVAAHSDYYPSIENQGRLFAELQRRGYDLTRNNLAIAYDALADEGQMDPWPQETEREPAPHQPEPQPVRRSSGLRASDASAMKPPPPKPKPLITRAELAKMSRREYEERLRDPAFRKAVDALGP